MKLKKFINEKIVPLIGLLMVVVILAFPFLSNKLQHLFAIICYVCSLIVFPIIILTSKAKDKKTHITTVVLVYYISISIFIINYFNTKYNWLWFIFGLIIIVIPYSWYFINLLYKSKNKVSDLQNKNFNYTAVKYTLFYYVIDLFYMSFIIDNLICRYIFGGIAILFIFYNSAKAFINNTKPKIIFIVQDVLFGLGITSYLIFIIPIESLRTIVTSIVSAVFGGYITLLGVAWTIKENNRNRREDERQSKTPYLYIDQGGFEKTFISLGTYLENAEEETLHCVSFNEFVVKNSSNSDCIPCGYILNDKFYRFDNMFFIERGKKFNVNMSYPHFLDNNQYNVTICIIAKDVLDNCYKYDCELVLEKTGHISNSGKQVSADRYNIINLKLPALITKEFIENNLKQDIQRQN